MIGLLVAIQFLTRVPMPLARKMSPTDMGRSMRWFPVVGALIGLLVGAIDLALSPIASPEVRAVLAVAILTAMTGALHVDGLMDTCDALFAFTTPERRLEIMRDSRVGSFAVVGAATMLLLKYAAILSMPEESRVAGFVLMTTMSRWAMVYATVGYPAARSEGLGHSYKEGAGLRELLSASFFALAVGAAVGLSGLAALLVALVATMAIARYAMSKLPGLSGDVYGAISEAVEVAVAVALPPIWRWA
ncbi:MAG: cobalamin 5'-phosphate synthase [Chloroflexi bacterium]|nr:cobalamin 5'-phosphate synthase [Chloroflexota bacterium]